MNARIERWNLRLKSYDFTLDLVKVTQQTSLVVTQRHQQKKHESKTTEENINFLLDQTTPKAVKLQEISTASQRHPTPQAVMKALRTNQWHVPNDNSIDNAALLIFKTVRDELYVINQMRTFVELKLQAIALYNKKCLI